VVRGQLRRRAQAGRGRRRLHLQDAQATKDEILADQQRKLRFLYEQLGVAGSKEMVARYVKPLPVSRPAPASLAAAATEVRA
jgi:hypothetical protein